MAIQELLLQSLTNESYGAAVVTLPSGLDGQGETVVVPRGVDLQLFKCKNFDLIHEGDGVLGLYGCDINTLQTKSGTYIEALDCRFNQAVTLAGTSGFIEGSAIDKQLPGEGCLFRLRKWPLNIIEGSDVELKLVNFGPPMQTAINLTDSGLTLQECRTLSEFNHCLTASNARLKVSRSQFYSTMKCFNLVDTSYIIVSSCICGFKDMGVACVASHGRIVDCHPSPKADGFIPGSSAGVNALTKSIRGAGAVVRLTGGSSLEAKNTSLMGPPKGLQGKLHDWGIKADLGSTATFTSSTGEHVIGGGDYPAIECNGAGSSVTVINYDGLTSQNRACVQVGDRAKVVLIDTAEILALDDEALNVSEGGELEIYRARKIQGQTWGAVLSSGGKLLVEGPTAQLEGMGEDGITSGTLGKVILRKVTLVDGAKAGIRTTGASDVTLVDVLQIEGKGAEGISMTGGRLLAKSAESSASERYIEGQTSGVSLSSSARALLFNYDRIEGQSNHGIEAASSSHVTAQGVNNILGLLSGVDLSRSSRFVGKDVDTIRGATRYGIHGFDACSVRAQTMTQIYGGQGGIHLLNASGYLIASGIGSIEGNAGHGVWFQGKQIDLHAIELIRAATGAFHGCVLEGAAGSLKNIDEIWGKEHGLRVLASSTIVAEKLPKVYGDHGPHGLDVISSTFTGRHCDFIKDGTATSGVAMLENCTFSGAFVASKSSLTFAHSRVDGHFEIDEVSYDILNCLFQGSHISTNSSGVSRNYTQVGDYNAINEGAVHTNLTLQAAMTFTQSSITIDKGSVSGKVTADSSVVEAKVVSFAGGIDTPNSSVELHACQSGGVTLNASSLAILAGNAASISAQNGSGIIARAASAGAVALTNSGLTATGGDLGTVTLSSSSTELHSTLATVNGVAAKAGLVCKRGSVVQAGTMNRYAAFDDHVHEWFKDDYRIYAQKELTLQSQSRVFLEAPDVTQNHSLLPDDPEVV